MLKATVVLRSYNRLDACLEAAARVLEQDYPSFELLIMEQSTRATPEQLARLAALEKDPRVRVERRPPLGGPGSRNEACKVASGDVILMLDDDDLPAHAGWLSAHMKNFEDPRCLATTGRHLYEGAHDPPAGYRRRAEKRVLSYNLLMWQRCYTRYDRRSEKIRNIHGTNSAIRRSTLERFGLWDTCTKIEDENSFCYRVLAGKRPDEYMVFDPDAGIIRRLDLEGGLDKRQYSLARYGKNIFDFFHNIVGHYHTARFVLLYPAYVFLLYWVTADWVIWESSAYRGKPGRKIWALAVFAIELPFLWAWWLGKFVVGRLRHGPPPRAPRLEPRVSTEAAA